MFTRNVLMFCGPEEDICGSLLGREKVSTKDKSKKNANYMSCIYVGLFDNDCNDLDNNDHEPLFLLLHSFYKVVGYFRHCT